MARINKEVMHTYNVNRINTLIDGLKWQAEQLDPKEKLGKKAEREVQTLITNLTEMLGDEYKPPRKAVSRNYVKNP